MRRQLALAAAAISSLIVLAFVVPLGMLVRTLAEDRAMTEAERRAQALVPVLATVTDHEQLGQVVIGLDAGDGTRLAVFLAGDDVLGDAQAGEREAVDLARRGRAFSTDVPGGKAVLQPVVGPDGATDVVVVFVPDAVLRQGVLAAWAVLAALGVVLVGVATFVADRMARRIVRPVTGLASTAERIGQGDLNARAELEGPAEIVEVADTLNRIAERIDELLTAEREEVADLSHRLRTPVTALRLDIDGLPEGEDKERLVADADALASAVDRLINEARRKSRKPTITIADLAGVARSRTDFWLVLAEDQERTCRRDIPAGAIPVASTQDDLAAVLDALLGNVFAHTPEGTAFAVTVVPQIGAGGTLIVEDDGPGLPSGDVLDRGTSGGGSTGLGLDIVRRTAEESGGRIEIGRATSGGARIAVTFGPPRRA